MNSIICIVGLGYVGLPLAHAFAKKGYKVAGFDVNTTRIDELKSGYDQTDELTADQLATVNISYSADPAIITEADYVIVAIPTPVDEQKEPDLTILKAATKTVGANLKAGAIVIFESTVYPGVTEDSCVPILESNSGLTCGQDFWVGYSPERINPGDKTHRLESIIKIVAGQNEAVTKKLEALYGSIITAGIHIAPSIKVAEMAKAIENAQRDLNIAFVNEVAQLCGAIGISSKEVLAAAGTKWNFLPFKPGLVGGHCIGVDPYYLVAKAKQLGMETHVITAGRAINDSMSTFIAKKVLTSLVTHVGAAKAPRVLLLGITFKENVPDTRNSKVRDVATELMNAGCNVFAHDPYYSANQIEELGYTYGILSEVYDAVLLLVNHKEYIALTTDEIKALLQPASILFDLPNNFRKEDFNDYTYLTL